MLQRLRKVRENEDRGFTLIELLVVVVIIGVLVAIAIPVYLNYRKGAQNTSASSDVRGAISAVEQYYTENGNTYPASRTGTKSANLVFPAKTNGTAETATVSTGNTLALSNKTSTATPTVPATNYYVLCAQNADGGTVYVYNSMAAKTIAKSTQKTIALCLSTGT